MKNKFFNLLINLNMTPLIYAMLLVLITGLTILFYITNKDRLNNIIDNKITKNNTLNNEKTSNKLFIKDELISFSEMIILSVCVLYIGYTWAMYNEYLHKNLTTNTYKVTQINYNNQYVTTTDNKTIKNPSKKLHIINEPTNNQNKLGKSYYIIKTYAPKKIAKILNQEEHFTNFPKQNSKYQTRLEQHIYVKPYKNVNNNK